MLVSLLVILESMLAAHAVMPNEKQLVKRSFNDFDLDNANAIIEYLRAQLVLGNSTHYDHARLVLYDYALPQTFRTMNASSVTLYPLSLAGMFMGSLLFAVGVLYIIVELLPFYLQRHFLRHQESGISADQQTQHPRPRIWPWICANRRDLPEFDMIQPPNKIYPPMDLRRYTLADTVVGSGTTSTVSSKIFRRSSILQNDVIESASPSMRQMSPMSSRSRSLSTELAHQTQVGRLSQEETARTQSLVCIEEMSPPPLTSSANNAKAIASLSQKPSVTEIPLGTANRMSHVSLQKLDLRVMYRSDSYHSEQPR